MNFEEAWNYIVKRSEKSRIPVVQDKTELEYVFNLMRNCNSYLEVGTAEGNSLYVLANAMPKGSKITYIDLGEKHTTPHRNEILELLKDYEITAIHGDSNDYKSWRLAWEANNQQRYDAVMIDAGHDDFNVAIDATHYQNMGGKYVFYHDVQIPDVNRTFEWICKQIAESSRKYRVVNSTNYGYGIIEV